MSTFFRIVGGFVIALTFQTMTDWVFGVIGLVFIAVGTAFLIGENNSEP